MQVVLLRPVGLDHRVLWHDVLEDSDALADDVRERFGGRVAGIVIAGTDDPAIADFTDRKAALREQVAGSGPDALCWILTPEASWLDRLELDQGVTDALEPLACDSPAVRGPSICSVLCARGRSCLRSR